MGQKVYGVSSGVLASGGSFTTPAANTTTATQVAVKQAALVLVKADGAYNSLAAGTKAAVVAQTG